MDRNILKYLDFKRIYLVIRKAVNFLLRGRYFIARRSGAYFIVDIFNLIDRHIDAFGLYEKRQVRRFLELSKINKSELFLDVGANSGMYCVQMALDNDFINIIAFEPDKRNISQLYGNLFINGLEDRVEVNQFGLSDRDGLASFNRFSDQNRGRSAIDSDGLFEIALKRADDAVRLRGSNICMKIDVEGHELSVLSGAITLLRENRCILQIECFSGIEDIIAILEPLGYVRVDRIDHDYYFASKSLGICAASAGGA